MPHGCTKRDCPVAQTATCLEGFEILEECPNYSPVKEEVPNQDEAKTPLEPAAPETIEIGGNLSLTPDKANAEMRKTGARVIVCAGPYNVGKTTLLAVMYELLQAGPLSGSVFGGSRTIFDFERTCHDSRLASGRSQPDTRRTKEIEGLTFLHLALKSQDGERIDLVLSNRAGESYDFAVNNRADCERLYEVRRADTLLFFVDAEDLCDAGSTHLARTKALAMIDAFVDADLFDDRTRVVIVMSRFDKADKPERKLAAQEAHKKFVRDAKNRLEQSVRAVQGHIIAARPEKHDTLPLGYGVDTLVKILIEPPTLFRKLETPSGRPRRTFLDPNLG